MVLADGKESRGQGDHGLPFVVVVVPGYRLSPMPVTPASTEAPLAIRKPPIQLVSNERAREAGQCESGEPHRDALLDEMSNARKVKAERWSCEATARLICSVQYILSKHQGVSSSNLDPAQHPSWPEW